MSRKRTKPQERRSLPEGGGQVEKGRTQRRSKSSREDVSVFNETGETNDAWNTVEVARNGEHQDGRC
jgi:hypothetical protein